MTILKFSGVLLAVLFVVAFVFTIGVIGYGLYRKLIRKVRQHIELGEIEVIGSEGNAKVSLGGKPCIIQFPVRGENIDRAIVLVIVQLQKEYGDKAHEIGQQAIKEWESIADSYDTSEDNEIYERMMSLRADPIGFLKEMEIQGVSIGDNPSEVSIEYMTSWDPEHSRSVKMDFDLHITGYGLTCGL